MSVEFAVAAVGAVFQAHHASVIGREIQRLFGLNVVSCCGESYYSEQLPWSGCRDLAVLAESELGEKQPQLEIAREFRTVYLAIKCAPVQIVYSPGEPPLFCGSLRLLQIELNALASARGLPTDAAAVDAYRQRPEFNDDEGYDIETYCHLQLAVHQAIRRELPLWVVR